MNTGLNGDETTRVLGTVERRLQHAADNDSIEGGKDYRRLAEKVGKLEYCPDSDEFVYEGDLYSDPYELLREVKSAFEGAEFRFDTFWTTLFFKGTAKDISSLMPEYT